MTSYRTLYVTTVPSYMDEIPICPGYLHSIFTLHLLPIFFHHCRSHPSEEEVSNCHFCCLLLTDCFLVVFHSALILQTPLSADDHNWIVRTQPDFIRPFFWTWLVQNWLDFILLVCKTWIVCQLVHWWGCECIFWFVCWWGCMEGYLHNHSFSVLGLYVPLLGWHYLPHW